MLHQKQNTRTGQLRVSCGHALVLFVIQVALRWKGIPGTHGDKYPQPFYSQAIPIADMFMFNLTVNCQVVEIRGKCYEGQPSTNRRACTYSSLV